MPRAPLQQPWRSRHTSAPVHHHLPRHHIRVTCATHQLARSRRYRQQRRHEPHLLGATARCVTCVNVEQRTSEFLKMRVGPVCAPPPRPRPPWSQYRVTNTSARYCRRPSGGGFWQSCWGAAAAVDIDDRGSRGTTLQLLATFLDGARRDRDSGHLTRRPVVSHAWAQFRPSDAARCALHVTTTRAALIRQRGCAGRDLGSC